MPRRVPFFKARVSLVLGPSGSPCWEVTAHAGREHPAPGPQHTDVQQRGLSAAWLPGQTGIHPLKHGSVSKALPQLVAGVGRDTETPQLPRWASGENGLLLVHAPGCSPSPSPPTHPEGGGVTDRWVGEDQGNSRGLAWGDALDLVPCRVPLSLFLSSGVWGMVSGSQRRSEPPPRAAPLRRGRGERAPQGQKMPNFAGDRWRDPWMPGF